MNFLGLTCAVWPRIKPIVSQYAQWVRVIHIRRSSCRPGIKFYNINDRTGRYAIYSTQPVRNSPSRGRHLFFKEKLLEVSD